MKSIYKLFIMEGQQPYPLITELGLWILGVMRPMFFRNHFQAVIPAKAGIQVTDTGFRVKPGMTVKGKGLLTDTLVLRCSSLAENLKTYILNNSR